MWPGCFEAWYIMPNARRTHAAGTVSAGTFTVGHAVGRRSCRELPCSLCWLVAAMVAGRMSCQSRFPKRLEAFLWARDLVTRNPPVRSW
jgi:hypothetical protein